jgi:type IV secretory pathway VirB10-like protein
MNATLPFSNKPLRYLIAIALSALACGSAMAQWQWVDSTGRKVFSDTAPPANIPEKNILKRPSAAAPAAAPAESANAGQAAPVAPVAPAPSVDPKLEAKRKEAEKEQAARRKAQQDLRDKARAENCERAKRSLATMNSGVRIRTTNANGESEVMDDNARAAETRRIQSIIQSDCGPEQPRPGTGSLNSVP